MRQLSQACRLCFHMTGNRFRLSYSSIDGIPFVCLAAHEEDFHRWATADLPSDFRNCQTSTATPAEPGDLPWRSDS
jgi:hypothetical protein